MVGSPLSLFDISLEEAYKRKGRKWNTYGPDIIPLWIADPDFPVIPEIKETIARAIAKDDFYYSTSLEVQEMMADKLRRVNQIEASADDVYITQGVLPAMWLACKYACTPGDDVLVTDPMYYPFYRAVEATETNPIYWKLGEESGYQFNVDVAQELITNRTKLLFVCNPHNPTGRVMTRKELKGIADLAVDNDLIVMVDELWEDIVYDGRRNLSLAALSPEIAERTITAFGFSKTYGVAGLQIGYLVATNSEILDKIKRIAQGVLRGTTNISKAAAKIMLSRDVTYYVEALLNHLHKMRNLAVKRLRKLDGVTCNQLEGTFLLFPNLRSYGLTSTEITNHLLKEGKVAVSDGSLFGSSGEGHIRINIATSQQILTEALNRIHKALCKTT